MKKECEYTRTRLQRYIAGHLFRPQQRRIARHLASCPVCSSELDAARRIHETRLLLRDVDACERGSTLSHAAEAAVSAARRLLYRPLWLGLLVCILVAAYLYLIVPFLHDPDLERLDASVRSPAAADGPLSAPTPTPAPSPETPLQPAKPRAGTASPSADPLVVTITVEKEHERASIRQINEAMKEHALLKTMQFSDTVREISGSLTAHELTTFFNRIPDAGKVSYKRSRLAGAGAGELLPFVVRLRAAPARPASTPAEGTADRPGERTVEKPADSGRKPVEKTVDKPADALGDKPADKAADTPEVKPAEPAPIAPPAQ
jgi:hypothetical protein